MSTVFFPLRTSAELFADRRDLARVERAKQAVVLYDTLLFEAGTDSWSSLRCCYCCMADIPRWRSPGSHDRSSAELGNVALRA